MLNNQPVGDIWNLQETDADSQHFGRNVCFDFSHINSAEIKAVAKDYIWQSWKTKSKSLSGLRSWYDNFKYFLKFAEHHSIYSFCELDNNADELYLSYLRTIISPSTQRPLSYETQRHCHNALKSIITWCRIHHPDAAPSVEIFTGNEFPGANRRLKVDFIPDVILKKINNALIEEENPYLKYGIIILESTGMRPGDLLNLDIDCIKPHLIAGYTISWFDHKNRRGRPPMPVRNECAYAVQQLLEITQPLREEANIRERNKLFIRRFTSGPNKGQVGVIPDDTMRIWMRSFSQKHSILDSNGEPFNLTAYKFRRTLGTDMLSKGTDLNVIRQVLGHTDPATTKRFYSDIKDKERADIIQSIGVIGNIDQLDDSSFDNAAEKEWFLSNKNKSAALCDGYCTKPFENGKICETLLRRHKCYSCSRYITTPEYLQVHKDHLARLEKQIEDGAIYGEHYAEHFRPTINVLKTIIERLEALQHD